MHKLIKKLIQISTNPRILHREVPTGFHPRHYQENLTGSSWLPVNGSGDLVGFDVDMAQLLARELKVKLEFIPVNQNTGAEQLQLGQIDLIMSGVVVTTTRLEKMVFSDPYMEATLCFIVPDYRRDEFVNRTAIENIPELKIGIPTTDDYFFHKIKVYLPKAEIVEVKSIRDFFETNKN